jgi:glycosyltransferase involved in cell wall biosynthesis
MHIIFVNYYSLACNSGGHILNLACSLQALGVTTTIFVPFNSENFTLPTSADGIECVEFTSLNRWLAHNHLPFDETLIVAWTPRENVRNFVEALRQRFPCRYIVHLEDNESLITATNLGLEPEALARVSHDQLDAQIPVDSRLSHPIHSERFIAKSHGATALIATLFALLPPHHKRLVFWPGAAQNFFNVVPIDYTYRRSLGIPDDELVLAYTGNLHSTNRSEVCSLYLATCILNRRGIKSRLLRTGDDHISAFANDIPEVQGHILHLGRVPEIEDVARVLSAANFLVQPGRSDLFNDYRFPSKLPEFFAIGRPVLLPSSNLGCFVRDGEDAIILKRGDGLEIANEILKLHINPQLCEKLAASSHAFAIKHFRWSRIAEKIISFYEDVLVNPSH